MTFDTKRHTGDVSIQSELEYSIRASLERADQEIRTALQKLIDPTAGSLTLPQEKKGTGGVCNILNPPDLEYSLTGTKSPENYRDANTQTPIASNFDEEGDILGVVSRKKLSKVPFKPATFQKGKTASETGVTELNIPIRRSPLGAAEWHRQTEVSGKMWDVQREMYIETTERTCVYRTDKLSSPPYMQMTIEDVHVQLGESARFEAVIEGNPSPNITWYKDSALLEESDSVFHVKDSTKYSLILKKSKQEDGGVYTCVARNSGGEVSCKAELIVHEEKKDLLAKKQRQRRKVHSFYEVKEEIGKGSFSFVKRVVHKGNKANCAAKFIPLRSKTRLQSYRERDILAAISHEKITLLLDTFETKKTLVLILELCSSEELLDRLFRKSAVTELEVKLYIQQILEGIGYLHEKNILHLDIKPPNILMVHPEKEDIKICDFGFAIKIDRSAKQYSQYGSPDFVSPEIVCQAPVSKASDIWAIGVISYLSMTCSSPFAGENDRATLRNVQNGKVSWDSPDFVQLSDAAKDFIKQTLQLAPEMRPTALECLSHDWFLETSRPEDARQINTKRLKFLVARSRWQRSLMSYKSVLLMRSIPELLHGTPDTPSLGVPRHMVEESSSSSTSGSSSDNEYGGTGMMGEGATLPELHMPVFIEGPSFEDHHEHESHNEQSVSILQDVAQVAMGQIVESSNRRSVLEEKSTTDKDQPEATYASMGLEVTSELAEKAAEEMGPAKPVLFKAATIEVGDLAPKREKTECLIRGSSADSALLPQADRSSMYVPRQSVIKSTFYNEACERQGVFQREGLPMDNEYVKHLERARRSYLKSGYSKRTFSGLREPLLEQFGMDEEEGMLVHENQGRQKRQTADLPKSVSFDITKGSPKSAYTGSSRSRSLDDYKPRDTSPYANRFLEKPDSNVLEPTEKQSQREPQFCDLYNTTLEELSTRFGSQKETREPPGELPDATMQHADGSMCPSVSHQIPKPVAYVPDKNTFSVNEFEVGRAVLNASHKLTLPTTDLSIERHVTVELCGEESVNQYTPVSVYLKELVASATQHEDVSISPIDQNQRIATEKADTLQKHLSSSVQFDENVVADQYEGNTLALHSHKERPPTATQCDVFIDTYQRIPGMPDSPKHKPAPSTQCKEEHASAVQTQGDTLLSDHNSTTQQRDKNIHTVRYQVTMPVSEHPTDETDYTALWDGKTVQIVHREETATLPEHRQGSTTQCSDKTIITVQFEDATLVSDCSKVGPASATQSDGENTILIVQHHRSTPVSDCPNQSRTPTTPSDNESTILIVRHQTAMPMSDFAKDTISSDAHSDKENTVLVAQHQRTTPVSDYSQANTSSAIQSDEGGTTVVFKHHMTSPGAGSSKTSPIYAFQSHDVSSEVPVENQKDTTSSGSHCTTKDPLVEKSLHLSPYSKEQSVTLECIVDEMVYLSEEMNVLAKSMSTEDESEKDTDSKKIRFQQDPPTLSAMNSSSLETDLKRHTDDTEGGFVKVVESSTMSVKNLQAASSAQHSMFGSFDQAQTPPLFHEHLEEATVESGSSSKTYFSHSGSSGTGRRSDNFSDFEEAGRESEVSLVEISDLLEERSQISSASVGASSFEPPYVHLSDLYDMKHVADARDIHAAQEASRDRSSLSTDELLQLSFEKETPSHLTDDFTGYQNVSQGIMVQTTQTFYENIHGNILEPASNSVTSEKGWSSASKERSSVSSEHLYNYPKKTGKEHRSSSSLKQRKSGLFRPYGKSEPMEKSSEQSLKQKVKASVANISRIIKIKKSSEQERKEDSAEQRRELSPGASFEGKRKSGLSSFKLSGLKSKEKVTIAPAFVDELTDQTVVLGHSITLSCRTTHHSDPTIEWFKDGIPIQSSDRVMISSTRKNFQLLTILAVTAPDLGIYACVATNYLGGASTCCIIKKAEIPCCPSSPVIAQMHDDGALVIWKPVESSHPVTYTLQCRKEGGEWRTLASNISDCCYFASNLSQDLVYSFRITCNSKAGMGPYSNPSSEVKIGDKGPASLQSTSQETLEVPDEDGRRLTPLLMASAHPTYAFQSEIKRGRFSTVRKCWEKTSGRILAAKMIPYTPENKQSKVTEYHILKKLHHTNIVQLHAAYVSPRHLVLILELCEGLELLHCLAQGTSYSELEVRDYLWQMLSAVEFLHANHILHLDIRSENTIVTEHKLLKLLDFGSAQVYTQDQLVTTGAQSDFIENMAPELLEGNGAIPQTDVWAVGVTAFIMLSADYPFCLDIASELEKAIKQGKIKFTKCYAGLSGGAVSFLQSTLWANAWGRASASECLQSPWLQEAGMATMQQVAHAFPTTHLRRFLEDRGKKTPIY